MGHPGPHVSCIFSLNSFSTQGGRLRLHPGLFPPRPFPLQSDTNRSRHCNMFQVGSYHPPFLLPFHKANCHKHLCLSKRCMDVTTLNPSHIPSRPLQFQAACEGPSIQPGWPGSTKKAFFSLQLQGNPQATQTISCWVFLWPPDGGTAPQ